MNILRVGVFMGGRSVEKEASFNSGRTVCDHLDSSCYTVIPIFQRSDGALFLLPWHFLHRGKISDFEHRLESQAQKITWDELPQLVDFMYLAIHGHYAEDGCLQGFLEILNIPYLGSDVFTSALCMDKALQKQILAAHGFNVPKGIVLSPQDITDLIHATHADDILTHRIKTAGLSLPVIVKPQQEGSSLGITVVKDFAQLLSALQHACFIQPEKPQKVIVEEIIHGMEFSCIILQDTNNNVIPLPPTEIIPEAGSAFFDYDQKYMPGRATKFTPARVSPQQLEHIQQTCSAVMKLFNITTIARIDGFLTSDNKVYIIDPNTLAGMGPTSFVFRQAAEIGMGHTALINHLIETELHAYGMLKGIS